MLKRVDDAIDGKDCVVSGAGNVALHVAEKLVEFDAQVLTLSNRDGYLLKEKGLDRDDVATIKSEYPSNGNLEKLADKVGAEWFDDEKPVRRRGCKYAFDG